MRDYGLRGALWRVVSLARREAVRLRAVGERLDRRREATEHLQRGHSPNCYYAARPRGRKESGLAPWAYVPPPSLPAKPLRNELADFLKDAPRVDPAIERLRKLERRKAAAEEFRAKRAHMTPSESADAAARAG